jgi:hypothetical protein
MFFHNTRYDEATAILFRNTFASHERS